MKNSTEWTEEIKKLEAESEPDWQAIKDAYAPRKGT